MKTSNRGKFTFRVWNVLICLVFTLVAHKGHAQEFDIGFIGLHGGVYEKLESYAARLQLKLQYFDDAQMDDGSAQLDDVKVLFLQHTRAEDRDTYKSLFENAKKNNPQLVVIAFQSSTADLFQSLGLSDLLTPDTKASKYYGNVTSNLNRLLLYTGATYLGKEWPVEPPEESETTGLYHPDAPNRFETAKEFFDWRKASKNTPDHAPRVLVTIHSTHLNFQQPAVADAIIREAEKQGAVAAAIVDGRSSNYETEALAFAPSVVIHTCHSTDPLSLRTKLNVPHVHSIFIRSQSIDAFQTSLDGLSGHELSFHVIGQELIGAIEPQVGAGTRSPRGTAEALIPIPDRIEHLVRRSLSLAKLQTTPVKEKKIAIVYYDREMGKGELMRGSSTGMHMNGPRSLLNVLEKMHHHGYRINPIPKFENELLEWMMARGRQIGVWAPAELDRLVRNGSPALVSKQKYLEWYEERIPADRRQQMEQKWGTPPGRFMVWHNGTEEYLVIPKIELGNVILLPQPLRGELHGPDEVSSQIHDKTTTPPHNYMATYFWLEKEYGANAVVHFGTHGSEFALPGKPSGLSGHDWPDILMGSMPNFNPWIIENMVESSPVKRRVYGTLISHLPPPIVDAGLSDDLENLHEMLDKWSIIEPGALKDGFQREISKLVRQARLDIDLKLEPSNDLFSSEQLAVVSKYLHDIKEETTPINLHVFGEPPRKDLLVPYLVQILRRPFLHALAHLTHDSGHPHNHPHNHDGTHQNHHHDQPELNHDLRPLAEEIVELVAVHKVDPLVAVGSAIGRPLTSLPDEVSNGLKLAIELHQAFEHTTDEVDNLLSGLDGKFIPPGPGNSPIRNPGAVPTGRNMYLLNPEEIPTKPSWDLGVKLAKELIENHNKQKGTNPTKIGFDLRSSATFRDYGVMESQILYLLGVEPVWDERNLVSDVRLIPRDELGRPRVDVFIAAGNWYESNLPTRLQLWDKAIRLANEATEADNIIRSNTQSATDKLLSQGISSEQAMRLARGRIFGSSPGNEQPRMLAYQLARSGDWESRDQIADAYLATHKHIYTAGSWGEPAEQAYDLTIQGTHTIVRSWSDHMTSPLASRYTWLQGGALSLAVERMTGKRPEYVFSDVRDPDNSKMINAEEALRREYRVRLFNRKWIEGMMKEGYAGADHMRFQVANSFAWEVMRPGSVGNDNWDEMKRVLIDDKLQLGLEDWFDKNNPFAIQDAMAAMLEAARKDYWQADPEQLNDLAKRYAANVAKNGLSGHITSGGNERLHRMVQGLVSGSEDGDGQANQLIASYNKQFDSQKIVSTNEAALASTAGTPAIESPVNGSSGVPAAPDETVMEMASNLAPAPTTVEQITSPLTTEGANSPANPPTSSADASDSNQQSESVVTGIRIGTESPSMQQTRSSETVSDTTQAEKENDQNQPRWIWLAAILFITFLGGFAVKQKI